MDPAQLNLLVLIRAISAVRIPIPDQRAVNTPSIITSPEAGRMIRTLTTLSLLSRVRQMIQSTDLLVYLTGPVEIAKPGGAVPPLLREHITALVLLMTLVTAILTLFNLVAFVLIWDAICSVSASESTNGTFCN